MRSTSGEKNQMILYTQRWSLDLRYLSLELCSAVVERVACSD